MNSVVLKGKLGAGYIDDGKVNELDERLTAAESNITQNATTIATKASQSDFDALTGRVTTAEERATTTPDWNQNDPKAKDYIKNKPGGYHFTTPAFNIEWDGIAGDKWVSYKNDYRLYKVSDLIIEPWQLENCKIFRNDEEDALDIPLVIGEDFACYDMVVVFISKTPCVIKDITFNECGVYACRIDDGEEAFYVRKIEQVSSDKIRAFDINALPTEIPHSMLKNGKYEIDFTNMSSRTDVDSLITAFNEAMATGDYYKCGAHRNGLGYIIDTNITSKASASYRTDGSIDCYFWGIKDAIHYVFDPPVSYIFERVGLYANVPSASEKCMYMRSSTSGSTKKFKITVDDSGTLSATEVT